MLDDVAHGTGCGSSLLADEIFFWCDPAMVTCDNHAVYNGAKEIADKHGKRLPVMAKYDEREGNSGHIQLSLRDVGAWARGADDCRPRGGAVPYRAGHDSCEDSCEPHAGMPTRRARSSGRERLPMPPRRLQRRS